MQGTMVTVILSCALINLTSKDPVIFVPLEALALSLLSYLPVPIYLYTFLWGAPVEVDGP